MGYWVVSRSSTVESAETCAAAAASIENDGAAPPTKITKVSSIRAKYLLKKHQSATHSKSSTCKSIRDQMEKYLNYDHGELISKNNKLILCSFWADVSRQVPALAKLAHLVPSVPASSAPVERVFSHGGINFAITSSLNRESWFLCASIRKESNWVESWSVACESMWIVNRESGESVHLWISVSTGGKGVYECGRRDRRVPVGIRLINGTHSKGGRIPPNLAHVYNHRQNSKWGLHHHKT